MTVDTNGVQRGYLNGVLMGPNQGIPMTGGTALVRLGAHEGEFGAAYTGLADELRLSYYGYDAGVSVRELTNTSGGITDTYMYDAFGNTVGWTGSSSNGFLYRGEHHRPGDVHTTGVAVDIQLHRSSAEGKKWLGAAGACGAAIGHDSQEGRGHLLIEIQGLPQSYPSWNQIPKSSCCGGQ